MWSGKGREAPGAAYSSAAFRNNGQAPGKAKGEKPLKPRIGKGTLSPLRHAVRFLCLSSQLHLLPVSSALCPTDLSCHSGQASYVCLSLLALAVLCPGFSLLGNPLFFVWEGGAYFWLFSLATAWHVGSYFPKQGLNSHPLHWMLRVLTTEPPG